MNLEDLVPPLELCKQIPAWKFADSALVWEKNIGLDGTVYEPRINTRKASLVQNIIYPAPTLQEIIPALVEAGGFHPEIMYKPNNEGNGNHWEVECFTKEDPDTVEDFTIGSLLETDSINPATAALKLWLRLAVEDGK